MKIKILRYLLIISLPVILGILIYNIGTKLKQKEIIHANIKHLPQLPLIRHDSMSFDMALLSTQNPTIIIYFNSSCSICKYEAKNILNHIHQFKDVNMLLISSQSLQTIRLFARRTKLDQYNNIHFCHITYQSLLQNFGELSTPTIFIYDKEKKLIQVFKGETKAEAILSQLNE